MIHPLSYGKPSHPSQPSRPDVESRCEGFGEGVDGQQNLHGYLFQIQANSVKVFPVNKDLHQGFEAICEGVTVVKVFHGIKGGKRFCLMPVILGRQAPDIECRKHGLRVVGSPHQGLVRGSDKTSAQLNTAHRQICIPAMRTGRWKAIFEVITDKNGQERNAWLE